ncbi:MAG: peptidase M14, partial [Methanobacteriota archaeon]
MIKKFLLPLFLCLVFSISAISQPISSPEDVFGFKMGADKKLVNWEQIVSYFQQLDRESPRVKVIELGKTTLDHPMIMAIISSKDVVANLDKYRQIQEQLANPYDLSDRRAQQLINDGKLVVLITMNIHSSEIGASQGALELAYELASSEEKEFASIRENLIVLIIPSLNPDGQDMITKWYLQTVGTPYEGSRMPYKYHHYADHDNNRDWHFFNLKETRLVAKVLYHDWYPEIVMDQHQMGSRGARLFLPPYADPVNPNVAPQLTASVNFIGNYIASTMQQKGYKGIVTGTIFNAFFEGTMSKTPLWHNRIGILTEAASVRYATPLYFPRTSLRGMGIDLPEYSQQTNFVDPWEGGWWRLRDIVNYQKAAALSLLQLSATYKERFKTLFYELNKQAIENPSGEKLQAFILPLRQHDPGNVVELLRRLQMANVKIYQADSDFVFNGKKYQKGDFIIPLNQPSRAYIKDVMERQFYPDLKEYPGGPPRQPYDVTAWTFPLQMGVESVEV